MDSIGLKLLQVAKSQLGYTEKSSGYTKFGDWYGKHVDKDPSFATAPWCDMFLAWAADKAGVQDSTGAFASTPDHAAWFKKQDAWGHRPEPGAVVFFSWSGGKSIGDIQHVGLVESVSGSTLHTIEANHHNQLARATRDMSQVVGFGYPSKVKLKTAPPQAEQKYVPRHSAPPPTAQSLTQPGMARHEAQTTASHDTALPMPDQQAALTGVLAIVLFGTVALAMSKSKVRMPVPAPSVRVRKRGKHHRTPVALPADVSLAELEAADETTALMPAVTAAVAAQAEDQEFWGKIAEFEDDVELAFWNSLHAAVSQSATAETAVL